VPFCVRRSLMTQFFTAMDGARLAFQDEGSGLPLLCLPGLTRTMGDFDYLKPHLPPVRLIRMDYRGRGQSAWTGAATYSIPQEAQDALALLDHLGVEKTAVLGSSRGGLIGMVLAASAKPRLSGLLLNDVGPVVERPGLERIFGYLGRNPAARTQEEMAERLAKSMTGFDGVPKERWLAEARLHYRIGANGLEITYDPALREPFVAAFSDTSADPWPLFDACAGLPLGLIRGANSDLLSEATAEEMRRRRPDMIYANVPGRGHLPFLDEPESLAAIRAFLEQLS
jgi:pimeloyl-ACP methyl ester carboxylesterase